MFKSYFLYPDTHICYTLGIIDDCGEAWKTTLYSFENTYVYSNSSTLSYKLDHRDVHDKLVEFNAYITIFLNGDIKIQKLFILDTELVRF
jgi:hypothetical protein